MAVASKYFESKLNGFSVNGTFEEIIGVIKYIVRAQFRLNDQSTSLPECKMKDSDVGNGIQRQVKENYIFVVDICYQFAPYDSKQEYHFEMFLIDLSEMGIQNNQQISFTSACNSRSQCNWEYQDVKISIYNFYDFHLLAL